MKANEVSLGWAMTQPDAAAAVQRVFKNWSKYELAARQRMARSVDQVRQWSRRKNETFTTLCGTEGDVFTHGDVVKCHAYLMLVFVVMCVAGWLEGGAA